MDWKHDAYVDAGFQHKTTSTPDSNIIMSSRQKLHVVIVNLNKNFCWCLTAMPVTLTLKLLSGLRTFFFFILDCNVPGSFQPILMNKCMLTRGKCSTYGMLFPLWNSARVRLKERFQQAIYLQKL